MLKSIADVERRLNDGIDRTPEEREKCIIWLTEFMVANEMTLKELDHLCFEDSAWVFDQIFEDDSSYTPSSTNGDYSPSNPWDAPGMSVRDFI